MSPAPDTASHDTELPPSLAANPRLGDWLRVLSAGVIEGGVIEVWPGKVELGQGVLTALAQVAAEELDVDLRQVRMMAAVTGLSPDEGYTAGSLSIQHSGAALRLVCAEARGIYLAAAAARLGVTQDKLTVAGGQILAPDGRATSYWELADDGLLDRAATGGYPPKPASAYRLVGTSVPRLDLPDKLTGRPRYAQDLSLDGLCYGRVVRPPARGATLAGLDPSAALALPGVLTVVRDGSFLGVVAEREEVALRAASRLRDSARWERRATLPDADDLPAFLVSADAETSVLAEQGAAPDPGQVAGALEATYHRPYLAHASLGPSSATALADGPGDRGGARLRVWSHTQGVYQLRTELARALGLAPGDITVTHVAGAGCYGHNGADDVALDAALLARAVPGRPVQVTWSRQDELGWAPFGAAAMVRISAEVDQAGDVLSWRHQIWGNGHSTRPGSNPSVALLAAAHRAGGQDIEAAAEPPMNRGGGAGRNSVPGYDFPAYQVVNHRLLEMPLRTSALRSLGAFLNVFAAESFMDELAAAAGRDPVEYRLSCLTDPRGRAVVQAAARRSGWERWAADTAGIRRARHRVRPLQELQRVLRGGRRGDRGQRDQGPAADHRGRRGLVINPDGAVNQVEGGAIQACSWALKEQVRFDRYGVTSDTWETYPILRFSEVPAVDVELLPGGGNPALGIGETAQGPVAAAIGNAVHDALGVRVRTLPFTADNVVAAMDG